MLRKITPLVICKSPEEIDIMKRSGAILAELLRELGRFISLGLALWILTNSLRSSLWVMAPIHRSKAYMDFRPARAYP